MLLSFSESLATKFVLLDDKPCVVRPTLIDLNSVELKYYPFMITLVICKGIYNVLSPKICVPKETTDIIVKLFNIITNKNEAKTMTKHIWCEYKYSLIVQLAIQIKHGKIKHDSVNAKTIVSIKKIIVGILANVFVRIVFNKY